MSVKVSPKYQVVIPETARKSLNLKPGTEVEVLVKGGVAYIVPLSNFDEIRKRFKGKLDSSRIRDKKDRNL